MTATTVTASETAEGKRVERAPDLGLFTLANAISVSRIIGAPLVIFALSFGTATGAWVALAVMVLAEISDMADGHVARRSGTVGRVGKILDPLADSLYRAMVFLGFMEFGLIPLWMVAAIICRDIIVAYLRTFSEQLGTTFQARISGKAKAVVQAAAQIGTVVLLIISGNAAFEIADPDVVTVVYWLMFTATLATLASGLDYARGVYRIYRQVTD